jgi:hypothetical protein
MMDVPFSPPGAQTLQHREDAPKFAFMTCQATKMPKQ